MILQRTPRLTHPPFRDLSVCVQSRVGEDKCFDVLVFNDRKRCRHIVLYVLLRVREPGQDPSQMFGMRTVWFSRSCSALERIQETTSRVRSFVSASDPIEWRAGVSSFPEIGSGIRRPLLAIVVRPTFQKRGFFLNCSASLHAAPYVLNGPHHSDDHPPSVFGRGISVYVR